MEYQLGLLLDLGELPVCAQAGEPYVEYQLGEPPAGDEEDPPLHFPHVFLQYPPDAIQL